ncbi:hypothetical protein PI125_g13426 [Phytophthora idaei]|nr:hypothetical protein PI125_g13426 [Phytophthora idaei]KAG3160117.1 hypothetical protein PI126_g7053 [Phytophthora idaei]
MNGQQALTAITAQHADALSILGTSRVSKTVAEKLVAWIETHGYGIPTTALKHFRDERGRIVSGSQIRQWWKKREQLRQMGTTMRRVAGGGAKPQLRGLEEDLFDQVLYLRSNKEKATRPWIQFTARTLASSQLGDHEFIASDRWTGGFMAGYGLSLRRTTNLTVLDDEELTDRAVNYLSFLTAKKPHMNLSRTVLMDETALYFEAPKRQMVDVASSRHVVLKSTGFASMRVTAVLAASVLGKKLTPLLIWKGATKERKMVKVGSVWVMDQEKAWVDSDLLAKWIDVVFPPLTDFCSGNFLVWDCSGAAVALTSEEDVRLHESLLLSSLIRSLNMVR